MWGAIQFANLHGWLIRWQKWQYFVSKHDQHNGPVVTMSQHFIKQQLPLFQISFTCNKTFTMSQICCFINPDRLKYQSFTYVLQHKKIAKPEHNCSKFFLRFLEKGSINYMWGAQNVWNVRTGFDGGRYIIIWGNCVRWIYIALDRINKLRLKLCQVQV